MLAAANESIDPQFNQPPAPAAPLAIAPYWHTFVLVAAIIAISIHGASRLSSIHGSPDRLATYGFSAAMEVAMLAWVLFGLRLRKTSLRTLLGSCPVNFRAIAADLGFALIFWIASLMVLGSLGIAWSGVEAVLQHRTQATLSAGQAPLAPDPSRLQAARELTKLAPANGTEVAAWALLCMLVGFIEEVVFRGYLQRQFIGWARGAVAVGVIASAIVFGGAHGYQGVRNMVMLSVFGALFSLLALFRRSLRAGIFVHAWHDFIVGVTLAFLHSKHIL